MAQNITIMGASYSTVPSVRLPKTGGGLASFDDTTDATAAASDIAQGKTAYVNGQKVVGTNTGGGGKNIQYYAGLKSIAKSSLSSTGVKVTVENTGNYKISWMAARSSSSGTMSTRLYVNSSAKDTDRTTWTNTYGQAITISSYSLTAGQTVEIYARSGSTSRQVMVGQLVIEEL